MTGDDVRAMRERLGWSVATLAVLLGVNRATAYRWEGTKRSALRLDPLHESLLTLLVELPSRGRKKGRAIARAVKLGGTLPGLAELLADMRIQPANE